MSDDMVRESDGLSPHEDHRYEGTIVGRVKRRPGIGRNEARKVAENYAWYRAGLKYDGRCKRWHVFRGDKL